MSEIASIKDSYESLTAEGGIELHALKPEDAEALFRVVDANRAYLSRYLPWADSTQEVSDSESFIKTTQEKRTQGDEYGFGIFEDGEVVGHISLMHINDGNLPEIGYWVSESVSGRGITTNAAKAVSLFGLNTLGLREILIKANVKNIGSNKVAEKLGYKLVETKIDEDEPNKEVTNFWILEK